MRAAVLVDVGRIEVRDVPAPVVRAHEVLVRVSAVGLCGTDLHIAAGHSNYHFDDHGRQIPLTESPQILGHEITGVVAEVGAEVRDVPVGARVVLDQGRTCVGERRDPLCEYCRSGDSHQCEWYREHGITGLPGGFAEYVAVPSANVVRIRGSLEPESAALVEPLGCVVHAAQLLIETPARFSLAAGSDRPARSILICGAGPSGLIFLQYLRAVLHYDGLVLVVEPNETKRRLAERFGGSAIDPGATDLVAEVMERSGGRRADVLFEASGSATVFAEIPGLVRKQGTVMLYGHGHTGVDLSVLNRVQFLEPTMISPIGASGGFEPDGRPTTYVRALRLVEEGRIDVRALVTHRYASIDAVPEAFGGDHRAPDYVKGVVIL